MSYYCLCRPRLLWSCSAAADLSADCSHVVAQNCFSRCMSTSICRSMRTVSLSIIIAFSFMLFKNLNMRDLHCRCSYSCTFQTLLKMFFSVETTQFLDIEKTKKVQTQYNCCTVPTQHYIFHIIQNNCQCSYFSREWGEDEKGEGGVKEVCF